MRHLYGRSIRALDDWLARILEQLDSKGLLDDTLVIVTSDHGENLGEDNLIGHAFSLSEKLIHVPLVVTGPGAFSSQHAFSLTGLPNLIAKAVGLSEHPWGQRVGDDGVVVSEYGSLGSRNAPGVAEWAADWGLDEEGISRLTTAGIAATDGRMKLVREHGPERLYDLRADPLEMHPIDAREQIDLVVRLRSAIEKIESLRAVVTPRTPAGPVEENEELEERLKLLGYM
jgi:arylsulfatase A-like enzyme